MKTKPIKRLSLITLAILALSLNVSAQGPDDPPLPNDDDYSVDVNIPPVPGTIQISQPILNNIVDKQYIDSLSQVPWMNDAFHIYREKCDNYSEKLKALNAELNLKEQSRLLEPLFEAAYFEALDQASKINNVSIPGTQTANGIDDGSDNSDKNSWLFDIILFTVIFFFGVLIGCVLGYFGCRQFSKKSKELPPHPEPQPQMPPVYRGTPQGQTSASNVQPRQDNERLQQAEARIAEQADIIRDQDRRMALYSQRVDVQPAIQEVATKASVMIDLLRKAARTGFEMESTEESDDYRYYTSRILNKFTASTKEYADRLDALASELRMASLGGLWANDGIIRTKLGASAGNPEALMGYLYSDLFSHIISPTLIMCDEFSYMLPYWVKGAKTRKSEFETLAAQTIKLAEDMGMQVNRVRPLDTKPDGVKNIRFFNDPDNALAPGQIFEVFTIGVNYKTSVRDTEVSAKEQ